MNYGVVFSQELQKRAFPIGALVGGGIGAGLSLLGFQGTPVKLPVKLALTAGLGGAGALSGHVLQSEYKKAVEADAIFNDFVINHPKAHISPDCTSFGEEAWNRAGLNDMVGYYAAQRHAEEVAQQQILRAALAERRKSNVI